MSPRHWPTNPIPSLAAEDDPRTLDRQLADQIAEHERVLARRPADTPEALAAARQGAGPGGSLAGQHGRRCRVQRQPARQLWHSRRLEPTRPAANARDLQDKLTVERQQARDAKDRRDEIVGRVAALQGETDAFE